MRSAPYQPSSYTHRASLRRQAAASLVAIVANILLIVMLLRMAPSPLRPLVAKPDPITFELLPPPTVSAHSRTVAKTKRAGGGAAPRPRTAAPIAPLSMMTLSKEEYAASDIAKLPSHHDDRAPASADAGSGQDSGSASGPGEGPNGERLYEAEWYREPTHAELAYYLPAGVPEVGWGIIACQTEERYHVDNCRELGDSPAGSGLARAVRQAAWQFLVLPPRIGGHPVIGAWVRIRIEFTPSGLK